jgi:hypothetical protein
VDSSLETVVVRMSSWGSGARSSAPPRTPLSASRPFASVTTASAINTVGRSSGVTVGIGVLLPRLRRGQLIIRTSFACPPVTRFVSVMMLDKAEKTGKGVIVEGMMWSHGRIARASLNPYPGPEGRGLL